MKKEMRALAGLLLLTAAAAGASEEPARLVVEADLGLNAWQGELATGTFQPRRVTPADRMQLHQSVSAGYLLRPRLRLQLTLLFGQTVGEIRPDAGHYALGGAALSVVFGGEQGFFTGVGPLFLSRSDGRNRLDIGVAAVAGYLRPVGRGVSMGASLQVPMLAYHSQSISLVPSLITSARF